MHKGYFPNNGSQTVQQVKIKVVDFIQTTSKGGMHLVKGLLRKFLLTEWNDPAIRQTRWNARRSRGPMEGSGAPREPVLPPFQIEDCEKY